MSIKNIISGFCLVFSLSGCSFIYDTFVYQIDITQGNYIENEKLDEIELGMTQEQVIFILGSPMLIDEFDSSKWYYIRYIKPGGEAVQQQQVVFTFKNKTLIDINRAGRIDNNPFEKQKLKNVPNAAAESSTEDNAIKADNATTIDTVTNKKK